MLEDRRQLREILPHLEMGLNRQQTHFFEISSALIPEEARSWVEAQVDEAHAVPIGLSALKPAAESIRVGKRMRLHVTRPAGDRVVGRKSPVVKQHAAERRPV